MINDQPIISQPENLRLLYTYLKDCIDQPAERAIIVHERNTAWFVITADLAEKGQIGLAIPFVYAITDAELAKHAIQRLIRVATNQQHLPYVQPLLNYAIQLNDRSDRYQAELYLAKLTMDATDPPATQLTATVRLGYTSNKSLASLAKFEAEQGELGAALKLADSIVNPEIAAQLYYDLANIVAPQNPDCSHSLLQTALAKAKTMTIVEHRINAWRMVNRALHTNYGLYDHQFVEQAILDLPNNEDKAEHWRLTWRLTEILIEDQQFDRAIALARLVTPHHRNHLYGSLAKDLYAQGQTEQADKLIEEIDDPASQIYAIAEIGANASPHGLNYATTQALLAKAIDSLQTFISIHGLNGLIDRYTYSGALLKITEIYLSVGDDEAAHQIVPMINHPQYRSAAWNSLAAYLANRGELAQAYEALQQALMMLQNAPLEELYEYTLVTH